MSHTSNSLNKSNYRTLMRMNSELGIALKPITEIISLCKDSLFTVFTDHLVERLQFASITSPNEEEKYDPIYPLNPIFNRQFKIYSMVAQDEDTLVEIDEEISEKYKKIEKIEEELGKIDSMKKQFSQNQIKLSEITSNNNELQNKISDLENKIRVLQNKDDLTKENTKLKYGLNYLFEELSRFKDKVGDNYMEEQKIDSKDSQIMKLAKGDQVNLIEFIEGCQKNIDILLERKDLLELEQIKMLYSIYKYDGHSLGKGEPVWKFELNNKLDKDLLKVLKKYTLPDLTDVEVYFVNNSSDIWDVKNILSKIKINRLQIEFIDGSEMSKDGYIEDCIMHQDLLSIV